MEYVQGGSPLLKENIHHGWLVVDGFIVDITADQFGQFPIIVERSTEFHSSFKDPERFDALGEVSRMHPDATKRQLEMLTGILPYL